MGGRAYLLAVSAVVISVSISLAQEKKISVADCQFAANPDEFLARSTRIRQDMFNRTQKLTSSVGRKAVPVVSADSLPQRNFIDQEILGKLLKQNVPAAPVAPDEEFFRRINLDLTGRIPTSEEVRVFLADTSKDKRDAIIDKLLASLEFTDRWTMWLGDLLQNTATLANAAVNRAPQGRNAFYAYIKDSVATDKPLSKLAIEVISGSGNNYDPANGAANFPMGASTAMGPEQDTYDTMLAKTTATFLGISSYDCLLCHNGRGHLNLVSAWGTGQTRLGAQQMAAFFSRMALSPASSPARSFNVTDAASGGYNLNTDSGNRPSRIPVGSISTITPTYRDYDGGPRNDNWRIAFAESMVADPMFRRNMANRLWQQMFGLGLVDPVDSLDPARLDPANPPPAPWELQATHPELLEKLAAELGKSEFRIRPFLKTLVQSTAYQMSSRYEGEWKEEYVSLFARHFARRMEAEEVHDAIAKSTAVLGDYAVQGSADRVAWAMQLPETVEPQSDPAVNNFLNVFLRGDRDTQGRSQSGSIQQQLTLMNDGFMGNRIKVGRSPKLRALAQMEKSDDLVDEMYLTFLSRMPTGTERSVAVAFLAKAADRNSAVEDLAWMCINKTEFMFSY